jgi:2-phosphoglycerate kinase
VLRHQQGDEQSAGEARSYHALALAHLRLAQPTVVLVGGEPGTGKSTLAARLADALGWVVLGSDTLRSTW